MKKLITILSLCLLPFIGKATIYYVSATGSDSNNGTSTSTPFQTIGKINSLALVAGDQVLFKRGDTFYGTIIVSHSGSSGNQIIYGAYGTGNLPIITGFTNVTSWTSVGTNLWQSSGAISSLGHAKMVVVNGVVTAMGRTPNTGWYHYQSHSGNTSLTSSDLTGTPNWAGAEAVIRSQSWLVDRYGINNQSGGTLNVTDKSGSGLSMVDGNGFYIQSDVRTLDQQNEWFFDSSTNKIEIYSTSSPTGVQVAIYSHLFDCESSYSYVTVTNLIFEGSEDDLMYFDSNNNGIKVEHCELYYAGGIGIRSLYPNNMRIDSNTIRYTNSFGISTGGNSPEIFYNDISNVGIITGLDVTTHNDGISNSANYTPTDKDSIYGNKIHNVAGQGIAYQWKGSYCGYNFIDTCATVDNDHGGIYCPNLSDSAYVERKIDHNIILHAFGYDDGSGYYSYTGEAIYLDDDTRKMTVSNNTVAFSNGHGIKLHSGHEDTVQNNVAYMNKYGIGIQQDGSTTPASNIWTGNVSVALSGDLTNQWRTDNTSNDFGGFGFIDNNYYAAVSPSSMIDAELYYSPSYYSLSGWSTFSGHDASSTVYSTAFTDSDVKFVYNPTFVDSTVTLSYTYDDAKGNHYNSGSITIHPFESAVLIKTGNLSQPTISMSGDQPNVTTSSTSVSATASWASGHTGTYAWTQTSGPNSATFGSATSASTTVSGLVTGTYIFRCTVTQDDSQTAYGEVTVTVSIPTTHGPYKLHCNCTFKNAH